VRAWLYRNLLNARWQTFRRRSFVAHEFSELLRFLRESGCTFHSCHELGTHPVPRGISFRYDIHLRDLPGAFLFADLHSLHGIPATFFLFWDYSPLEHAHLHDFLRLRERIAAPLEIGLHDSPVDTWLLQQKFEGDRRAYLAWLNSEDAIDWFSRLAADDCARDEVNRAVLDQFKARAARTRELFGCSRTVAAHGGELGQQWRERLTVSGQPADIVQSLLSYNWLTPERVRAAGLDAAVDSYGNFVRGWNQFSCQGGTIASLAENIRRSISVRNSAIQILLHPYTWTGGERDAELSKELFVHGAPQPMNVATNSFRQELQQRWPVAPSLARPVSQLCTASQFREPAYAQACTILGEKPRLHRKQWEFAYILRCVERAGGIGPERRGLGFIGARERLPAVFAAQGCRVIVEVSATSPFAALDEQERRDALFFPHLLQRDAFDECVATWDRRTSFLPLVPKSFDFCWSCSVASHSGSLEAGFDFLERSLEWLKPGGVAVHTLEFNLASGTETVRNGPVVLYRESDLLKFIASLRRNGHDVSLNMHPGAEPDDLRVEPDNPEFHLKLYIRDILATSAGLCITKAA
jgi:hypothetical protein